MWFGQTFLDALILCSDLCTCGTFVSLALNLRKKKSGAGLSLQSLSTVVAARCLHLLSHWLRLHYLPAMLPWVMYAFLDMFNVMAGVGLLATFVLQFFDTYEREKDDFGIHIFERLDVLPKTGPLRKGPAVAAGFLYLTIVVLALLWYCVRRSNHSFAVSYFCCFYEVMGAVALIPQLWMFQKDKRVSPLLANFVVLTALNRMFTLVFWIAYPRVYIWRYPDNRGIQMASEGLNLLILSDFLYYWARSQWRGDREVIIGDPDV
mmetsp:Transcript_13335/g.38301  ORF Transcript_13335/g.38301 Transcript_13335/m.38301 type:complete len:263 (+) Transcript_13335:102-890(+)